MSPKEKLWYLIDGLQNGVYKISEFCSEFNTTYNVELDYRTLSENEYHQFRKLSEMAGRFSDSEDDLKTGIFYTEDEVRQKANEIRELNKRGQST